MPRALSLRRPRTIVSYFAMLFVYLSESFVKLSQATYLYLDPEGAVNIVATPALNGPGLHHNGRSRMFYRSVAKG